MPIGDKSILPRSVSGGGGTQTSIQRVSNLQKADELEGVAVLEHKTPGFFADEAEASVWYWDDAKGRWRLGSTLRKWALVENWSSGEVDSNRWEVVNGSKSLVNVDEAARQVSLTFNSGDAAQFSIRAKRWVDLSADLYVDGVSLGAGGQPSSGSYNVQLGMADLDDGGGSKIADHASVKYSASDTVYRRETVSNDSDTGGGFTVEDATSALDAGETYITRLDAGSARTSSSEHFDAISETQGGADRFLTQFSLSGYSVFTPYLELEASSPDVGSTMTIGRVWVRR